MATLYKNIRIHKLVDGGDDIIMYPQTLDTNIIIDTSNPQVPSGVSSINDLVDTLGGLAFETNVATNTTTTTNYSTLRFTDDPTANSSDIMASSKAVSAVDSTAVKTTGTQEVDGAKAFANGLNIGGTKPSGSSSITGGMNITYDAQNDKVTFS